MVRKYCKLIFFIAAVVALVLYLPQSAGLLRLIFDALRPVLIAVFFALVFSIPITFISNKLFKKIKKERVRYALSLGIVYVLVFGLLGVGIYFLVPEVIASFKGFAAKLPTYGEELKTTLANALSGVGVTPEKIDNIIGTVKDKILNAEGGAEELFYKIKNAGRVALDLFFAVILSVYILLDQKHLIKQIKQLNNAIFPVKVSNALNNAAKVSGVIFAKFLGGQVVESMLLAALTFAGMLILKLPYAPLISAVVFISNLIPLLGAYIGGAVGFVLIAFVSVKQAVIFIIFSVILQQFENNVTYPKVVGNSLGLSGFWIMSAVLVGGALFGFWGIILGVPAVAVIYKLIGHTLKNNRENGALIPDMLKPANESGGDCPEKGRNQGNGDGGA